MSDPQPGLRSPDGKHWWDGERWQPVRSETAARSGQGGGGLRRGAGKQVNADGEWEPIDDSWVVGRPSSDGEDSDFDEEDEPLTMQELIRHRVAQGYRVVSQTERTAQLVKPKSFNALIFVILLLLCLFPAVVYVAMYVAEKDRTFYLEVGDNGRLLQNGSVARLSAAGSTPSGLALVTSVALGVFAVYQVLAATSGDGAAGHLIGAAIAGGVAVVIWRGSAANR